MRRQLDCSLFMAQKPRSGQRQGDGPIWGKVYFAFPIRVIYASQIVSSYLIHIFGPSILTNALLQSLQVLIPGEQTVEALSELSTRRVKVIAVPESRFSFEPRCAVLHTSRVKNVNGR